MTKPICIFGPTAAGKTALSIALAQRLNGVVINADAMQVYADLRVVTARPSAEEEAQAPHRLFGVLDAADPCNAARWASLADAEIARCTGAGQRAILVGGTGLYFRALLEGIDEIPVVDPAIREEVRLMTLVELREALAVTQGDRQRLSRQLEVLRQTGQTLDSFYQANRAPRLDAHLVVLLPPRAALYERIDQRFETMLSGGEAQREVRALLDRSLPSSLPSMRAIGVPELAAVWRNDMTLEDATAAAQQASRRYAKRQFTWARNQVTANVTITELLTTHQRVARACDSVLESLNIPN